MLNDISVNPVIKVFHIMYGSKDGWMNGVLGHFFALSRLNWAGGQPGLMR